MTIRSTEASARGSACASAQMTCALPGAFLLHLPVYFVYLMVMTEEVVKMGIGLVRFASRKWINKLAHTV